MTTALEITRGDNRTVDLLLTDPDDNDAPIDLSGCDLWFYVKAVKTDPDSSAVLAKGPADVIVDPDQTANRGQATVPIVPADTDSLAAKYLDVELLWEVQLRDSTLQIQTVADGTIVIRSDLVLDPNITPDLSPTPSSFTYDPEIASPGDEIRFLIQDTNANDVQFSNAELTYLLSISNDDPLTAAARGAERLAAKYARAVDKSVGNLRISASQKAEAYRKLAQDLWGQASRGTFVPGQLVLPYAGGISRADKLSKERDTNRVRPAFTRRMMRYSGGSVVGPFDVHGEERAP